MEPHEIELPRKVLLGHGVIRQLPSVCKEFCASGSALVLSDRTTMKVAGEAVAGAIGCEIGIINGPEYDEAEKLKEEHPDIGLIVSVGGGKTIDTGKFLAFDKGIPLISAPTAPSHDGIASERVSITRNGRKYSARAKPPVAIVADVDILLKAPYRLIASGCADVVSNFVSVYDWKLGKEQGEYYSKYAATLALLSAEMVKNSAMAIRKLEERGIRDLLEAIITSGISMSLAQSSRPASGSEHMFSHAMEGLGSTALHGQQCGLGSIAMACLQGQDWKGIRDTLSVIGSATTARELGVDDDMVVSALVNAKRIRDRHTILNIKPLDENRARELCEKTGIFT